MAQQVVIVGAGQAGAQAALTLRQQKFEGDITLLGEEPDYPYQRPPLSKKYLSGELDNQRLLLKPEKFYAERSIEARLATGVTAIDPSEQSVTLEDGRGIGYDKLLLATGSRVRRIDCPGCELPGIHYLRTRADVDRIREDFDTGSRLVIVGGGYIGLEVAAVARSMGLEVTILEAMERVMARVVAPEVSDFYAQEHRAAGVTIECGCAVAGFEGSSRLEAVISQDGRSYPCDLAIVGIGVVPNTELAANAGLEVANGIVVDEYTATSADNVFAAGDCTDHPNPLLGARIRLESVANAIEQAKAAALNILGQPTRYEHLPWFWSDQYDLKLQIVGLANGPADVVIRGDAAERSFSAFYLDERERVVAVDAINQPKVFMAAKKIVLGRMTIPPEVLRDEDKEVRQIVAEFGTTD